MIERVVKTNEALNRSLLQLRNAPVPLSLEELTVLEEILKVLSCFEEATKKIQGNTYVTISLVIPLTFGIYNSLISTLPELQTEEGKTFCNNLLQSVRTILFPYETRSVARLDVIITKRQYLERPKSNTDVDPLLFWKVAGEDLKPMEQVARKFFCIPATSAESERVFSLTGQLIENRRSRLKQKNVDRMVFLNKNFKI
ncbi:hypothetical protein JTB14_004702 [Gonioctena quinquepunctata]|nr:hypothetical protein JTB14_004702 [Gonioctena quinquepunctata]